MNDLFPKSQDEWNDRYISDAPMEQEFHEITYCSGCLEIADPELHVRCPDNIMGQFLIFYQCSLCEEESEDEECDCYKK